MFTHFLLFLILTEKVNPVSILRIQLLFPAQRLGNLVCTSQHTRIGGYSPINPKYMMGFIARGATFKCGFAVVTDHC